jgi:hypothetical protein
MEVLSLVHSTSHEDTELQAVASSCYATQFKLPLMLQRVTNSPFIFQFQKLDQQQLSKLSAVDRLELLDMEPYSKSSGEDCGTATPNLAWLLISSNFRHFVLRTSSVLKG